MHKADEVLARIFDRIATPELNAWSSFCQRWSDIVGEELKDHVKPLKVEYGILFLEAEHPGWVQIVKGREKEIIKKINQQQAKPEVQKLRMFLSAD